MGGTERIDVEDEIKITGNRGILSISNACAVPFQEFPSRGSAADITSFAQTLLSRQLAGVAPVRIFESEKVAQRMMFPMEEPYHNCAENERG